ncbi:MAG: phosphodiester glycosidase family protein [Lachnospiraceae bacterium]|nr:phosphodiester glycosidase family protein [Lachnospiraceae bacterium]
MIKNVLKIVGRIALVLLTTIVILAGTLFIMLKKCCNGPSEAARDLFITTILETGQLKFLAGMVCTDEQIQEVVNKNSMSEMDTTVDTSLISINTNESEDSSSSQYDEEFDENGIRIEEISGRTFFAKMMIIKDPSQVVMASVYNNGWPEYGKDLDVIVSERNAIAGVNAGIYQSAGNKGGQPLGVVVQDGKITYNNPSGLTGLYMIGLNNDNILIIKDLSGMSSSDFERYVQEEGIRDAHCFQEESSDANNHFVSLISNGEAREFKGSGSGANPRTAIGQRADGAILLLVTDGRGASGHLGATASDLISIMQEYGAVNAANLDGGSSSTMVYNNAYEMTSVTFYYQNSSWKLPTAFAVLPKEN